MRRLLIDTSQDRAAINAIHAKIEGRVKTDGLLGARLALHPQVALRPEPFGALAYHYDTRRLVFLKHPDVVAVVRNLGSHPTTAATLEACGIETQRWPAFVAALTNLVESNIVTEVDAP